jgi:hypothetical protein
VYFQARNGVYKLYTGKARGGDARGGGLRVASCEQENTLASQTLSGVQAARADSHGATRPDLIRLSTVTVQVPSYVAGW